MATKRPKTKWTKEDFIEFLEVLIEHDVPVHNNPYFRKLLTRDENLFVNQSVRHSTGNVAYRTVDNDVDEMSDDEFWSMVDSTDYNDLIEDNAAIAILKMAEKFNLIN